MIRRPPSDKLRAARLLTAVAEFRPRGELGPGLVGYHHAPEAGHVNFEIWEAGHDRIGRRVLLVERSTRRTRFRSAVK